MLTLTSYRFETIALIFSTIGILVSLFFEFVLNSQPCKLCLWQRYLMLAIFCFSILSIITSFKSIVLLILGTFLALISVSGYHAMIQLGFLTDLCSVPMVSSRMEFWEVINSPIPCSKISASIFGIPLSVANAVFSTGISCLLTKEIIKKRSCRNVRQSCRRASRYIFW